MSPLAHTLSACIILYRWTLSPFVGRHCRFLPTCSEYGLEALSKHGAFRGTWLTVRRLGRCHPWGGSGFDPVPDPAPPRVPARTDPPERPNASRPQRHACPASHHLPEDP